MLMELLGMPTWFGMEVYLIWEGLEEKKMELQFELACLKDELYTFFIIIIFYLHHLSMACLV